MKKISLVIFALFALLICAGNSFAASKIGTMGAPNSTGTYPMEAFDDRSLVVASDATFTISNDIVVNDGATITGALGVTGAAAFSSTITGIASGSVVQSKRVRSTIAQVNAGVTLLAATPGRKYKLVNVKMIAVGGAVTSTNVTHLEVRGTVSAASSVLFKVAKAQLTQSAVNQVGTASTTVLADGASFIAMDENTAITLNPLGGTDAATATNVDIIIDYIVE